MASSGIKNRELKREKVVVKYQARREALQARMHNSQLNDEERMQARLEFQKLPRNSSRVRLRRRCAITGRPRGVFRKFNLCRNILREMAMRGEVPGMTKASW